MGVYYGEDDFIMRAYSETILELPKAVKEQILEHEIRTDRVSIFEKILFTWFGD